MFNLSDYQSHFRFFFKLRHKSQDYRELAKLGLRKLQNLKIKTPEQAQERLWKELGILGREIGREAV